jgi:predicted CXXCH cytochrome family protein
MRLIYLSAAALTCFFFLSRLAFGEIKSPEFSGSNNVQDCVGCHQQQGELWQDSHHAKSMQVANKETVLADFSDREIEHKGQKARFTHSHDKYFANISDGQHNTRYQVKYTFGVEPLQQYLVETPRGKMQVMPFAWDSRLEKDGGQRWMHLYPAENISPKDRLHWLQPLQNWNGMCADCHSGGLKRNYNSQTDSFNTHWQQINIGCMSCHDGLSAKHSAISAVNKAHDANTGYWARSGPQKTSTWHGPSRDNRFMDTCFACHALRSPLTDGFSSNKAFLDQFSPSLLSPPLYYPDGQIKGEVYVYGSFLQSKMFQNGVNCQDCHDPHSLTLKAKGNALCTQCHSPEVFDSSAHHQHPTATTGAQCINCHMPETTYMNVDRRRDHSFKIPRPEISVSHGIPNACNTCHQDKSAEWAVQAIAQTHSQAKPLSSAMKRYLQLQSGDYVELTSLLKLAGDVQLPTIQRAAILSQLVNNGQTIDGALLDEFLQDEDPLIRLSAAQASGSLSENDKQRYLRPLLIDPVKAVRVASANQLLGIELASAGEPEKTAVWQTSFEQAFTELRVSNQISSWRGEGRVNQALLAQRLGDGRLAEDSFLAAIRIEPYFADAYLNLTEFYRSIENVEKEQVIYQKGLAALPNSAEIHFRYGLHLIRQQQYQSALSRFKEALDIDSLAPQYAYFYYLLMHNMGHTQQAIGELQNVLTRYRNDAQLSQLLQAIKNEE